MTHEQLCRRARAWLRGTRRCEPVYSRNASCDEIPDAIGWSSVHGWYGSTVVECKTSVGDFYAEKKKFLAYEDPKFQCRYPVGRIRKSVAEEYGYKLVELPRMGDFRFFMCIPGVLSDELVAAHHPDHGLLHVEGRRVHIVRPAQKREAAHKDAEILYLRFAIINRKKTDEAEEGTVLAEVQRGREGK